MVEITGRIGSGTETNHLLHVGGSFELTLLKSGFGPISQAEIDSELLSSLPAAVSLEVDDEDQTLIFSIARPLWLQQILNAQLRHWFKHQAETYYQFSPWPMIGEEYVRGIKAAPYWALARWKKHLFPQQIKYCMQRSPAGAVAFCIERIPPSRRKALVFQYAAEALTHATEKLTEEEMLTSAAREPRLALRMREKYHPALRARMLIVVIPMVHFTIDYLPPDLEPDILKSIALFPSVWLAHYGSFTKVMDVLSNHLAIIPNEAGLQLLLQTMDPREIPAFYKYMASCI
jgi:hypothetical protein